MKKFVTAVVTLLLFFTLLGCDLLSTIIAVKDFSVEYREYADKFSNTDIYTIQAETTMTVNETTLTGVENLSSTLYFEIDESNQYMYMESNLNGEIENAVLIEDNGVVAKYILQGDYIYPTLLGQTEDGVSIQGELSNIKVKEFDFGSLEGVLKSGESTYEFDIMFSDVVDLESLSDFVASMDILGIDITAIENATVHVVLQFINEGTGIQISVTLTDYAVTLDTEDTLVISLTNQTTLSIPSELQLKDILDETKIFMPSESVLLCKRVYEMNESILMPLNAGFNGYVAVELKQGVVQVTSNSIQYLQPSSLYDQNMTMLPRVDDTNYNEIKYVIPADGIYYFDISTTDDVVASWMFVFVVVK